MELLWWAPVPVEDDDLGERLLGELAKKMAVLGQSS